MFDNLNFAIINTYKDLCTNLLLNKNDPSIYSWPLKFEIFSLIFIGIHYLNIQFGTTLIIWVNYQHYLHYKCHFLMINLTKFIIYKLLISYQMNIKYPWNLSKPLKLLLIL